jgi:hypothetical protein
MPMERSIHLAFLAVSLGKRALIVSFGTNTAGLR